MSESSTKLHKKSQQFGNLTINSFTGTQVIAAFVKNSDNPGVLLSWNGFAWCAAEGTNLIAASWKKDPTKYKKLRVQLVSAAVGLNATTFDVFDKDDNSVVGKTVSSGVGIGICGLDEIFDVERLTSTTLTPKKDGQKYRATSAADFYIFDKKIKYGQDDAPVIKRFRSKGSDRIGFSARLAKNMPSIDDIQLKTVQSSKKLEKASLKGFDFIYLQPKGHLYHDTNSEQDGFGDGGLMALLHGSPDLDNSAFHLMA